MLKISFLVLTNVFVIFMDSVESDNSFFPQDLTLVTWAHGANSQAELQEAFITKVKMIEADMQMGTLEGSPPGGDPIPIMAHPPAVTSDLSFQDFMDKVVESNKNRADDKDLQGVKLDFKTIETVEPALRILSTFTDNFNFPIWLNADILRGPVNSTGNPVNASEFLRLTAQYRPGDTLSIGWTTRYGSTSTGEITEGEYTEEEIQEMIDLLADQEYVNRSTPITFPLRAGIAAQSLENIVRLLKESWDNPTVTLWQSNDKDFVDMDKLLLFVGTVTKERCFTDLPFELKKSGSSAIRTYLPFAILTFLTALYSL